LNFEDIIRRPIYAPLPAQVERYLKLIKYFEIIRAFELDNKHACKISSCAALLM